MLVDDAIPDARRGLNDVDESILGELKRRGHCADEPFLVTAELLTGDALRAIPHVYDRVVALAQDFTTRYPLIDGKGNFGSYDDDPPAEARYTEVRLSRAGEAAVDDGRFPSLLANGATGSRTVIPPHNVQGIALVLSRRDARSGG